MHPPCVANHTPPLMTDVPRALYRILAVSDISQPQAAPKKIQTGGGRILDTTPADEEGEACNGPDRPTRCLKFALCPAPLATEEAIVTAVELEELPFRMSDLVGDVVLEVRGAESSQGVLLLRPRNTRLVPDRITPHPVVRDYPTNMTDVSHDLLEPKHDPPELKHDLPELELATADEDFLILDISGDETMMRISDSGERSITIIDD